MSTQPVNGKKEMADSSRFDKISLSKFLICLPQVSGIQVVYNIQASPNSRVCSIKTCENGTWTDLDDERSYPMVVAMYIADGGDRHTALAENK